MFLYQHHKSSRFVKDYVGVSAIVFDSFSVVHGTMRLQVLKEYRVTLIFRVALTFLFHATDINTTVKVLCPLFTHPCIIVIELLG